MIIGRIEINGKTGSFTTLETLKATLSIMHAGDSFSSGVLKEYNSLLTCPLGGGRSLVGGNQTFSMRRFDEINADRFERFIKTYLNELEGTYSEETHKIDINGTYHRMVYAFASGTYNKDSQAIKNTCKVLKIKHTYKAINSFLTEK